MGCAGTTSIAKVSQQTSSASRIVDIAVIERAQILSKASGKLSTDEGVARSLTAEQYELVTVSVDGINRALASGDLSLQQVSLDSVDTPVVTRANSQGIRWYWWGCAIYLNNSTSQKIKTLLQRGDYVAAGQLVSGAAGSVAGPWGSGLSVVFAESFREHQISEISKGRGVAISLTWWRPYFNSFGAQG
jgi:hypothetical protein